MKTLFFFLLLLFFSLTIFAQEPILVILTKTDSINLVSKDTIGTKSRYFLDSIPFTDHGGKFYLEELVKNLPNEWTPLKGFDISDICYRSPRHGGKWDLTLLMLAQYEYRIDMIYKNEDKKMYPYFELLNQKYEPINDKKTTNYYPCHTLLCTNKTTGIYLHFWWFSPKSFVCNPKPLGAVLVSMKKIKK